jgi:hypothetical protein
MNLSKNIEDYFRVMYRPGEFVCYGATPKDTKVCRQETSFARINAFTTINPLFGDKDINPTEDYHAIDKPRRADHNVSAYRNFLIEIDSPGFDLVMQRDLIESIKTPWSTCVYSGNKSLHYIICLTDSVTAEEYKSFAQRIHKIKKLSVIDPATKNPSRFTRTPNVLRASSGCVQQLIGVRETISVEELEKWLMLNDSLDYSNVPDSMKVLSKNKSYDTKDSKELYESAVKRVNEGKRKYGTVAPLHFTDGSKYTFIVALVGMCRGFGLSLDDFLNYGSSYITDTKALETIKKLYNK